MAGGQHRTPSWRPGCPVVQGARRRLGTLTARRPSTHISRSHSVASCMRSATREPWESAVRNYGPGQNGVAYMRDTTTCTECGHRIYENVILIPTDASGGYDEYRQIACSEGCSAQEK
ncbi:hypothetical protein SEA_BEEGEE_35 [Gordonia phage BeeGee]|nr:hypothetical protein SEA_BEEGEE_35 [Gordonia phage BeeGee]